MIEEYALATDDNEKKDEIMKVLVLNLLKVNPNRLAQIIVEEEEKISSKKMILNLSHTENKELMNRSDMLSHLVSTHRNYKDFLKLSKLLDELCNKSNLISEFYELTQNYGVKRSKHPFENSEKLKN